MLGLEASDDLASFFGLQEVLTNNVLTVEQKFSMMDKVTLADIKSVAEDIFQNKNLNLAVIGPLKDKAGFEGILKF